MQKLIRTIKTRTTTFLSSLRHYFNRLVRFRYYRERFKEFQDVKKQSGVVCSFYSYFSKSDGFYLKNAELPKEITWLTLISFERLQRRAKRAVVRRHYGRSSTKLINESKIRRKNFLDILRNRLKF